MGVIEMTSMIYTYIFTHIHIAYAAHAIIFIITAFGKFAWLDCSLRAQKADALVRFQLSFI